MPWLMSWTGDWRKAVAGALALGLHLLLALYAFHYVFAPPAREADREVTLTLSPLAKPAEAKKAEPVKSAAPTAPHTPQPIIIPKNWTPPQWTPQEGTALQGLGASLGCSASDYDSLTPAERAACRKGPWKYDAEARETASLIIKAPHVMSAADRAERIRSTVDPCAAEKLTHQTDCIFKVIYGDKLP
jgi:hypothetical protein